MSSFYDYISSSLRSTELALVTVDAHAISSTSTNISPDLETAGDWHGRRILAVVSHKDEWALTEEGALFVYKPSPSPPSAIPELILQTIYPIYGNFSIAMSQMRRNTLDLGAATSKAILDQPRSGFSLTINPAEESPNRAEAPTFYTNDVQGLSILIAESKRLKEASEIGTQEAIDIARTTSHFSWLRLYSSRQTYLSLLSSVPPDLRVVNKPLYQRLSPASAGLPGDDSADILLIRDEWIRNKARELVRQGRRRISLRLGTFNVNGKLPSQDLSSWVQGKSVLDWKVPLLPPFKGTPPISIEDLTKLPDTEAEADTMKITPPKPIDGVPDPDMFVLGFQELDLSTEALIYSTSTTREDAWCVAIFAALGEKAVLYEKVASKQLVGMLIVILVKKSLKSNFGDIKASSAGSGLLGMMGNKGATAVRLTFTPTLETNGKASDTASTMGSQDDTTDDFKAVGPLSLTFVNAHLAAFDEMVDRRNQEFHELSRRLAFGRDLLETEATDGGDDLGEPTIPTVVSIYETDALFWMIYLTPGRSVVNGEVYLQGLKPEFITDLNYRVDIPDPDFRRLLADKNWDDRVQTLIRYDQLKKSVGSKKAFDGFIEYSITHLPTYRFTPNLPSDQLGYDLKRRPAWTDRILYIPGPCCNVTQHSYTVHPQITMSDHRPVAAHFSVDFDLYEKVQYEATVRRLYREMHALDGSHERPEIKLDQSYIDFGEIRYFTHLTKKVVIENAGKIPCAWRFVPVQSEGPIHPEWLSVEPLAGMFLPGKKTEVKLTIQIDNRVASPLNLGPRDMSGTLILHTILGKDHFISVSGVYLPSCFGNKLTTLTRLPGPIRSLTSSNDLRPEDHPVNAPREIMRLVNWLMGSKSLPNNLFLAAPDETMIGTIRECLDTGENFPWSPSEGGVGDVPHAFAGTLIRLLDSLVEPIVPSFFHARCVQMKSRDEAFELLDALQPAAVNVWITVTAFLHFICQSSGDSSYAERISDIFTSVLMRDDPESMAVPVSPIGKRKFFLHFIS